MRESACLAVIISLVCGGCFRSDRSGSAGDVGLSQGDPVVGDPAGDFAVGDPFGGPPVAVTELDAPFTNIFQGQIGVPFEVTLVNATADDIELHTLELSYSRDASDMAAWVVERLPLALTAAGATRVHVRLSVGAPVAVGDLEVNATAFLLDRTRGLPLVAGPADQPAIFRVGSPVTVDDDDGDGLSNALEVTIGSSQMDPDTDWDGIDDGIEAPLGVPHDSDNDTVPDILDDDSDQGGEPDLLEWWRNRDPLQVGDDREFVEWMVTDTTDDLDPGTTNATPDPGPTTSLREALTIAANRPGPDRIRFATAQTTINITGTAATADAVLPEITDADTFIDGNGTIIYWDIFTPAAGSLLRVLADDVTIRNLVIDLTPSDILYGSSATAISLDTAIAPVIAGVTIQNRAATGNPSGRGVEADAVSELLVYRVTIVRGSGRGLNYGVVVSSGVETIVRRCELSRVGHTGLSVTGGGGLIEENRISGSCISNTAPGLLIRDNDLGFCDGAVNINYQGSVSVEDNFIHDGTADGIVVGASNSHNNTFRRNLITRNAGQAIVHPPTAQGGISAPMITTVETTFAEGTHTGEDGVIIEVFADPDDEAERYLGTTTLLSGIWRLDFALPVPVSHNLTATATDANGNTSMLSPAVPGP